MPTNQETIGASLALLKNTSVSFAKSPELPQVGFIGYNMHKMATLAIGLNALKGGEKRILAFGLPGSGVQRFPHAAISDMQRKLNIRVSLVYISCPELILSKKIAEVLDSTSQKMSEAIEKNVAERGLVFVLIDNPEALSCEYENFYENKKLLVSWLTSVVGRKYDRTVLFCTSDDPSKVEENIIGSFDYPIYLRYLDIDSLVTVIKKYLEKREDAQEIASKLYSEMENERKMKLVSAEVIKALQMTISVAPNIETCSTEQAVTAIRDHIWPCYPEEYVKEYEERNSSFVSCSEDTVKRWASVLNDVYLNLEQG
jgi:hypothetical protein